MKEETASKSCIPPTTGVSVFELVYDGWRAAEQCSGSELLYPPYHCQIRVPAASYIRDRIQKPHTSVTLVFDDHRQCSVTLVCDDHSHQTISRDAGHATSVPCQ